MVRPTPLIVLALLLCSSREAVGQIWERFTFQDSFSGKFSGKARRVKPASFSVLLPGDTTASYSIRSAMRVNFGFETLGQKIAIGPFVEYRLLTNIKKPQNVFMVGLSTDWQTRDAEAEGKKWSAVLAARVIYKTDYERSTRSVLTDLLFTPVAEGRGGGLSNLFLPNVATQFGSAVEFTYSPSIGLEHESVGARGGRVPRKLHCPGSHWGAGGGGSAAFALVTTARTEPRVLLRLRLAGNCRTRSARPWSRVGDGGRERVVLENGCRDVGWRVSQIHQR